MAKFVGFYLTLAIDMYSDMIFFSLLSSSWAIIAIGVIFCLLEIWHFQRQFTAQSVLLKNLHRYAWLIMAVLNVYFMISLGVAITEPPKAIEVTIDVNAEAIINAVSDSKVSRINALVREQDLLLSQNNMLIERLATFGQWSNAAADFQRTIATNTARLDSIAIELQLIGQEEAERIQQEQERVRKTPSAVLFDKLHAFVPIGAPALLSRVLPRPIIAHAIVLLFALIGIVLEITLALASLPTANDMYRIPQKPVRERANKAKRPPLEAVLAYLDEAWEGEYGIKSDDAVGSIPAKECKRLRKYLSLFIWKGKPIIEKKAGAYMSLFSKTSMRNFIVMQYNVKTKQSDRQMKLF